MTGRVHSGYRHELVVYRRPLLASDNSASPAKFAVFVGFMAGLCAFLWGLG
jgi:hypothetical protein